MTTYTNGVQIDADGRIATTSIGVGVSVPATAIPLKGEMNFPLFGKFVDATGAIFVRVV